MRDSTIRRMAGFTLLELMMVVVVVGILVAIAVPSYQKTIELERWRTARDLLMTIYYGERTLFTVAGQYKACAPADTVCWNDIRMDNPNLASIPMTFSTTTAGFIFRATAQRKEGGSCDSATMWIEPDPLLPPHITTGTGGANSKGWGTDTDCQCC